LGHEAARVCDASWAFSDSALAGNGSANAASHRRNFAADLLQVQQRAIAGTMHGCGSSQQTERRRGRRWQTCRQGGTFFAPTVLTDVTTDMAITPEQTRAPTGAKRSGRRGAGEATVWS
jgi:hypothetical protein